MVALRLSAQRIPWRDGSIQGRVQAVEIVRYSVYDLPWQTTKMKWVRPGVASGLFTQLKLKWVQATCIEVLSTGGALGDNWSLG